MPLPQVFGTIPTIGDNASVLTPFSSIFVIPLFYRYYFVFSPMATPTTPRADAPIFSNLLLSIKKLDGLNWGILNIDEGKEWSSGCKRCGMEKEQLPEGFQRKGYMNESNTHPNERDPEVVLVWDCIVKDDLKELIGITYTNKIYLFFNSP